MLWEAIGVFYLGLAVTTYILLLVTLLDNPSDKHTSVMSGSGEEEEEVTYINQRYE